MAIEMKVSSSHTYIHIPTTQKQTLQVVTFKFVRQSTHYIKIVTSNGNLQIIVGYITLHTYKHIHD